MKELQTAFEYISQCELYFYQILPLHQKINYKSNWFVDPVNGMLTKMLSSPDIEKFQLL